MAWINSIKITALTGRISLAPTGHTANALNVAALEGGNFTALWHSRASVSAPFTLSLARLGGDGSLLTPVANLGAVPRNPLPGDGLDITALSGGGFALFYAENLRSIYEIPESVQARDLLASSILGRRYDATGTELAQDFMVNGAFSYTFSGETRSVQTFGQFDTYGVTALPDLLGTATSRSAPALAASADGGHWLVYTANGDIAVRRFSGPDIATADIRPLPSISVSIAQSVQQLIPKVAELTDGAAVIVWQVGASASSIQARILNGDGTTRTNFVIADATGPYERAPDVVALPNGNFVVVWTEVLQDFSDSEIMAQIFSATGQAQGAAFRVNTITNSFQSDPNVAVLPDGGFVVVWQGFDPFFNQYDIKARRFAVDGTPIDDRFLGGEWNVTPDSNSQVLPSLSINTAGQMSIGWLDFARFDPQGPTGSPSMRVFTVDAAADQMGTGGNDTISADPDGGTALLLGGNDSFTGGAGADLVRGNAGNDTLQGAGGADWLGGDEGNDVLYGGDGADTLEGGEGDDVIGGGAGNDLIYGGTGNDTLYGGFGNDTVEGGAGNDQIFGAVGRNQLFGGDGNDFIQASAGGDFIGGGAGNDTVRGGDGADTIYGGLGDDNIGGGAGNDLIFGAAGANIIWGGLGNDTVQGGTGSDTIYGGGDGTNQLFGNDGDDLIFAGTGGDFIGGGAGNDIVRGGVGNDTIYGGLGNDDLAGGAGDDVIFGSTGNNTIWGGLGNDTLHGGTGKDVMNGGPGADTFVFASAAHIGIGLGRDVISGFQSGVDQIDLRALNTTFNGTAGVLGGGQASFFYFAASGLLIGDQNGNGAADWVLELAGAPGISVGDLLL